MKRRMEVKLVLSNKKRGKRREGPRGGLKVGRIISETRRKSVSVVLSLGGSSKNQIAVVASTISGGKKETINWRVSSKGEKKKGNREPLSRKM